MIDTLLELERVYRGFDTAADELSRHLGVPICVPGCGKCCLTTLAHRIEAIYALSTLTAALEQIVNLAEGWLLDKHKQAPTYEGVTLGFAKRKLAQEFWDLSSHTPCPFLTSDKFCLIYRGRPMVCRAYGVTHMPTPTPDFCSRPRGIGETDTVKAWADVPSLQKAVADFIRNLPDPDLRVAGLLPTAIFKQAQPDKYRSYIEDNRIASAKLIGLPQQNLGLLWQEQMTVPVR